MPKLYEISEWILQTWNKPQKGSRPNNIYENPITGELFYLKLSKANFPSELWSEIIASKLGQALGFDVLDYNIGYDANNEVVGCLSKSMIDKDKAQTLYHGVDILKDYIENFEVTNKPIYSFQDLQKLCTKHTDFELFLENFVEIIVFDAIVGNTDRHTENWAFITNISLEVEPMKPVDVVLPKKKKSIKKLLPFFFKNEPPEEPTEVPIEFSINLNLIIKEKFIFSPIYDSGSCLGREIAERKIEDYLKNQDKILQYIDKGMSEIRWNDLPLNLFETAQKVANEFPNISKKILKKINIFEKTKTIKNIVSEIDTNLVNKVKDTFLSVQRKELITQILEKRLEKVKQILQKND